MYTHTSDTLCKYVAWLAHSLSPNSVKHYLNVVRILHIESEFPNPLENDYALTSVLRGVQRLKGSAISRKLPVTLDILRRIRSCLNLDVSQNMYSELLA